MRFQSWYPALKGDTRVITKFAFFPIKFGNDVRWLEIVRIKWEYQERHRFLPPCAPYLKWVKVGFVDES